MTTVIIWAWWIMEMVVSICNFSRKDHLSMKLSNVVEEGCQYYLDSGVDTKKEPPCPNSNTICSAPAVSKLNLLDFGELCTLE